MYLSLLVVKGSSKSGEVGCARTGWVGASTYRFVSAFGANLFVFSTSSDEATRVYRVHQTRGRDRASDGRFKSDTRTKVVSEPGAAATGSITQLEWLIHLATARSSDTFTGMNAKWKAD